MALLNNRENEVTFSDQENTCIKNFLSQEMTKNNFLKLHAYLIFLGKGDLWRTLKDYEQILNLLHENITKSIQTKLKKINDLIEESSDIPLKEDDKLTSKDIHFLLIATHMKRTLEALSHFQIPCPHYQEIYNQWKELKQLRDGMVFQHLNNLCFSGHASGQIAFFDFSSRDLVRSRPLSAEQAIKHVFGDRLIHTALIVKNSEICISHMGGQVGHHAIHQFKIPIIGAFSNIVELDISPLIPNNVSQENKVLLQKHFLDTFIRFASIEHPEVRFEGFRRNLITFFLGHKSLKSHDLSEVDLSSKQSHICSSYVGIIFLKAVHEVNLQLATLGYTEKIQHPFGRHEILDNASFG